MKTAMQVGAYLTFRIMGTSKLASSACEPLKFLRDEEPSDEVAPRKVGRGKTIPSTFGSVGE